MSTNTDDIAGLLSQRDRLLEAVRMLQEEVADLRALVHAQAQCIAQSIELRNIEKALQEGGAA